MLFYEITYSHPPLNTDILCLCPCYTLKFYIPLPLHHWGRPAAQGRLFTGLRKSTLQVRWGKKYLPCKQMTEGMMDEEVEGEKCEKGKLSYWSFYRSVCVMVFHLDSVWVCLCVSLCMCGTAIMFSSKQRRKHHWTTGVPAGIISRASHTPPWPCRLWPQTPRPWWHFENQPPNPQPHLTTYTYSVWYTDCLYTHKHTHPWILWP